MRGGFPQVDLPDLIHLYWPTPVEPKIRHVRTSEGGRSVRHAGLRQAKTVETPGPRPTLHTGFVHVTLPTGSVCDLAPCTLPRDDLVFLREAVSPKLRRGSLMLPAQPRYRLSDGMAATGGQSFVLPARPGTDSIIARIGWRDHGASLVWAGVCGPPRRRTATAVGG